MQLLRQSDQWSRTHWPHSRSAHHSSVEVSEERQMTHCTPGIVSAGHCPAAGGGSGGGRQPRRCCCQLPKLVESLLCARTGEGGPAGQQHSECRRRRQPGAAGAPDERRQRASDRRASDHRPLGCSFRMHAAGRAVQRQGLRASPTSSAVDSAS